MRWLIDGYNVILTDPRLAKMLRNDNEQGRHELISRILATRRLNKDDITVVFDGRYAASSSREGNRLLIRFTARGETADDFIKREVGKSQRRRSLVVVSNDRSILAYARECGAGIMGSGEFLAMTRERKQHPSHSYASDEKPDPPGKPDPELLKLFTGKRK